MDEMDLVKQVKDVSPLRPEAYERARATLGTAMVASERPDLVAAPARKKRFTRTPGFRVGVGVVGIAAAVAVVVSVTSVTSAPPAEPTAQAPAAESRLVTLAADVKVTAGSLPGDASLVISSKIAPDGKPYPIYTLYTDKGQIFFAQERGALAGAVARGEDLAVSDDSSVVAAARFAASSDLDKARLLMINAIPNAWGVGLSPAEAQKAWDKSQTERISLLKAKGIKDPQPQPRPTGKALEDGINGVLWNNSFSALTVAAANPEVRAGVLRLISTIPEVKVDKAIVGGQPVLNLTAGSALFAGHYELVLTINAQTGLPIRSETSKTAPGDKPAPPRTYESSRVKVADIAAGKF
ncbi:hypothetical protein [Amycolatopsis sp. cmx-8-4]|uniref:hypothetical protein n=1 Tax=Amycolatopsis sp. cmx-8-4 TaxID=2790947 RepID=UPI00397CAF1A